MSPSRPGRSSSSKIEPWDYGHGGYVLENDLGEVVAQGLRLWKRPQLDEQGRTVLYDADETEYVPAKRLGRVRLRG